MVFCVLQSPLFSNKRLHLHWYEMKESDFKLNFVRSIKLRIKVKKKGKEQTYQY